MVFGTTANIRKLSVSWSKAGITAVAVPTVKYRFYNSLIEIHTYVANVQQSLTKRMWIVRQLTNFMSYPTRSTNITGNARQNNYNRNNM